MNAPNPFVVKPGDQLAPLTIASWLFHAERLNTAARASGRPVVVPREKLARAAAHLAEVLDYQAVDVTAVKFPD